MVRCSEYESECVMPAAIFADRWRCAWAVVGEAVRIKPSFDLGSVSRLVHDNAELRAEVERMRAVVEAARALVSWDWLWALPDGQIGDDARADAGHLEAALAALDAAKETK